MFLLRNLSIRSWCDTKRFFWIVGMSMIRWMMHAIQAVLTMKHYILRTFLLCLKVVLCMLLRSPTPPGRFKPASSNIRVNISNVRQMMPIKPRSSLKNHAAALGLWPLKQLVHSQIYHSTILGLEAKYPIFWWWQSTILIGCLGVESQSMHTGHFLKLIMLFFTCQNQGSWQLGHHEWSYTSQRIKLVAFIYPHSGLWESPELGVGVTPSPTWLVVDSCGLWVPNQEVSRSRTSTSQPLIINQQSCMVRIPQDLGEYLHENQHENRGFWTWINQQGFGHLSYRFVWRYIDWLIWILPTLP